jgi:hypothetical protein
MPEGGSINPPTFQDTIPSNSRKTYNMADKVPNGKAAIYVTCTTAGKQIMPDFDSS